MPGASQALENIRNERVLLDTLPGVNHAETEAQDR
jgi:hypothetical protein